TDRCSLRCSYCRTEDSKCFFNSNPLSPEEIETLVKIFAETGIRKVRFTGGEPLLRSDIADIIKKIVAMPLIEDISVTTNGVLLKYLVFDLKSAGLKRINISLDSLCRRTYAVITGDDRFYDVIEGIDAALDIGFSPVKINTVVMRGVNSMEIRDLLDWAEEKGLILRFIEYMPVSGNQDKWRKYFVSRDEILSEIGKKGEIISVENIDFPSGGPAEYFQIKNRGYLFGIISSVSRPRCFECDRIRINSSGDLFLCLYDMPFLNLRNFLYPETEEKLRFLLKNIAMRKNSLTGSFRHRPYNPIMCSIGG
ncbi:MAG: GTP 3',8-cyclase MoaA, partial [Candidatus Omnitrophica bacterium]|nr:GTP 3',8-cyclase MoaA [Candidatus Omnitrophota bacterium]